MFTPALHTPATPQVPHPSLCFHPQIANTHRHSHGEAEPDPSPQLRPRGACCRLAGFNITTASGPAPADSRAPSRGR